MVTIPKILLSGASGWFGQSFIYSFIKMYGYENIDNLCLLTSDGKDIHHKLLNQTFTTNSLQNFTSSKKIDLFVQAAFLTRDKIDLLGESQYKEINQRIITDSQNLAEELNPSTRVLISSGAVNNTNDIYGQMKSFEEKTILNSNSSLKVIFRVYGAMGINTPLLKWSAISDLISSAKKSNIIVIKSRANVIRGYVSFEKLSELILKISTSKLKSKEIILSAVEHSNNLNEIANIISNIGKFECKSHNIDFNQPPDIYSADPTKFLNILDKFGLKRTSIVEDIVQTMNSPHLN